MKNKKNTKLLARITGILASGLVLYFIIGIGLAPENQGNQQIISINTLFAFLIFGFLIAWFREKEGGIILTFGSLITYLYFSYLPAAQFPLFWLYSFAYTVPGLLFLYYAFGKPEKES